MRKVEHRPIDVPGRQTGGLHGNHLGVGREASDRDQDAHQERHRDRQDDDVRQGQRKELENDGEVERPLDDQLRKVEELIHQDDERVEAEADQSRRNELPEDVASQGPHVPGAILRAVGRRQEASAGRKRAGREGGSSRISRRILLFRSVP